MFVIAFGDCSLLHIFISRIFGNLSNRISDENSIHYTKQKGSHTFQIHDYKKGYSYPLLSKAVLEICASLILKRF
jgi:hypothetical protein